ncbi:hypothetical protein [Mycolicibacterium fortuitum]|jgi:hypothetical protein|uniref:Uncharacterized protein n=2 Tax=Mycolicibacterium fortuitum TaxID=1766 RepID=A0AAE5AB64_MYCFO|nr:hypothetical protein [Mycolicibacterium fortuitum]MCA4751828.1 hypothetical protein [Mycolicibacterium fortuitum]MCV7140204.1 hypothetical protein [Mycolicibacterium fortuitum]MDV7190276.1 hypothetical protein [Mycolicibacterium fortuitum]MDV7204773.1 hypothetical protein [Mycolicibacterium fortuitum]MDV7227816.1 hypothetical protein [Mycolicibacterium fortuitum]
MVVRQFCEYRTPSAVVTDGATPDRQVADYLAGYAEALADRTSERPGVSDD